MATEIKAAESAKATGSHEPKAQADLSPDEVAGLRARLVTAEARIGALEACGPTRAEEWTDCLTRELAARGVPAGAPAQAEGAKPEAAAESPATGNGRTAAGPAAA